MPYIARQPVFDRNENVVGYELLFRCGLASVCRTEGVKEASRRALTSAEMLCCGRRAFLNCSRDMLLGEFASLLPSAGVALEISTDAEVDEALLQACDRLKAAGHMIVRKHAAPRAEAMQLLWAASAIDPDLGVPHGSLSSSNNRTHVLATRINTRADFNDARDLGLELFQGGFFCEPVLVPGADVAAADINCIRILQAVSRPQLDLKELEQTIKAEPSFCYRLLRYLNSAVFFLPAGVNSIRHALALLGETNVRRWLAMMATVLARTHTSDELMVAALVRARFCEVLARSAHRSGDDGFLTGLFSHIEALLGLRLASVLPLVPLSDDVQSALADEPGPLHSLFKLVVAYERGCWEEVAATAVSLGLADSDIFSAYCDAVRWADDIYLLRAVDGPVA